jgi:hypothetical protein
MLNATEFVKHNEETEKAKLASLSQLLIDSEINKEIEKLIINDEKNKIQYITLNDLRHIKNRHNFTYTIDASFPSATSGVLPIAYINLRGLQMRFGSYVDGSWVGKTVNKQATEKLNITLRYTYLAE